MIDPSFFTPAIVLMAMITFGVRYAFFTTRFSIRLHPKIRALLIFTAPCVLTAMLIPIMFKEFITTHELTMMLQSRYFWAGLGTIIFSLVLKNTLLVILLSMSLFYGLHLLSNVF